MSYSHVPANGLVKAAYSILLLFLLGYPLHVSGVNPKPLTLTCPDHQYVTAAPNSCTAMLNFENLDWSSSVPLTDTLFWPGPGFGFPIGSTVVTLTGTEVGGGTSSCNFLVTVNENTSNFTCKSNVPVNLGPDCTKTLTLDMLLQAPWGCPTHFSISLVSGIGNEIPGVVTADFIGPSQHIYKVKNTFNGEFCTGTYVINENTLPMAIICPSNTLVQCSESLDAEATGSPTVFSCLPSSDWSVLNQDSFNYSFCNGDNVAFKLFRKWRLEDIYGNQRTCTQQIEGQRPSLNDVVFPYDYTLTCDAGAPYQVLTDTSITGVPLVNGASLFGNECGFTVSYNDNVVNICGVSYEIQRLWTVNDVCGNTPKTHTQLLHVVDNSPPDVSLPDTVFVSSNNFCGNIAQFPPASIIGECSSYIVTMTTPWNTTVANGGNVQVNTFPGTYPVQYTVSDACSNTTTVNLKLVAKPGVIVGCPKDTIISCGFYEENIATAWEMNDSSAFDLLGLPGLFVNCDFTRKQTIEVDIDDCGNGTVTRDMGLVEAPNHCIQHVQIVHPSGMVVEFPASLSLNCSSASLEAGEPVISGLSCQHLSISHSDVIGTAPNACYQIQRTWTVVDTCLSNGTNTIVEQPESQLPSQSCDLDGDGDCDSHTFKDTGDGYLSFQQIITVTDTVKPVFVNGCIIPNACVESTNCFATVFIPTQTVMDCSPIQSFTKELKMNGFWINAANPITQVPPGNYEARYTAIDKCQNQKQCVTSFQVKDCQPPTAICKTTSSWELKPSGELTVLAVDYNQGSTDNCPGSLKFSFSSNSDEITKIYSCDDVGLNTAEIWVTDVSGNQSHCTTTIEILDNVADCDVVQLAGQIVTEINDPVNNVFVSSTIGNDTTDTNGNYNVGELLGAQSVEITPFFDEDPDNGVTTFDVVLVRKHILGNQFLDSPYKIIAADANNSNTITTFDLVVITKVILGNLPNFTDNTSWRFVPQAYVFPSPTNPFLEDFPESIEISASNPVSDFDFVAIKIGDVNNSVEPGFAGSSTEKQRKRKPKKP